MVVYYINRVSESLADYHFPIKEGDICMLYDGEVVKTIFIDSEIDENSIWRDFKFIDTKSLKSYQFPKSDGILCAPIGKKHAIGDTGLLTQLIKECKGEWLMDFLNETSAVLSGFVYYWDLHILSRLTGDDNVKISYEEEEILSKFVVKIGEDYNEAYDDVDDSVDINKAIVNYCLTTLTCIEDQIDRRSYQILEETLNRESLKLIALKHNLSRERIRQIIVKSIETAKNIILKQRRNFECTQLENAKLNVQINLLKDENDALKARLPKDELLQLSGNHESLNDELMVLLETPISDVRLSVRAIHTLSYMEVKKFGEIPQIDSFVKVLKIRNCGKNTVREIIEMLKDFQLSFGMSYTEVVDTLKTSNWKDARRHWFRRY